MQKKVYVIIALCVVIFLCIIGYWTVFPRTGTIVSAGHGVYIGQLRGKTFHGQGTWETEFGIIYTGEFKNGVFHGTGTMSFPNGATFEGEFNEGHMHGHGIMTFPDGHTHEGNWDFDELQEGHEDCDHE